MSLKVTSDKNLRVKAQKYDINYKESKNSSHTA